MERRLQKDYRDFSLSCDLCNHQSSFSSNVSQSGYMFLNKSYNISCIIIIVI